MLLLIGWWLARWHTAVFFRVTALVLRVLTLLLPPRLAGGPGGSAFSPPGHARHRHEVPAHSEFRMWYLAPRMSATLWLVKLIATVGEHTQVLPAAPPGVVLRRTGARGAEAGGADGV